MIPKKETMTVEFKSDKRGLSDHILVEEAVAMANSDGGTIYLGVENNGDITGVKEEHLDPEGVRAMIANLTHPPLFVSAEILREDGRNVLSIHVPVSAEIISTSSGKTLQRGLRYDGEPEMKPLYPYEFLSRRSYLGGVDPSLSTAFPFERDMIDPRAIEKALTLVARQQNADKTLSGLDESEFLSSMECVFLDGSGKAKITLAGLLLFGKKDVIARLCPNARYAFQLFDGDKVAKNDEVVMNILDAFDAFLLFTDTFNFEDEFMADLVRVGVPYFDLGALREGFANAIAHRDYSLVEPILCAYDGSGLTITSPGRLIKGLNAQSLIGASPRGRNPHLSIALKRLGLCEKSGRGIDRIYASFARFGKTWPSYDGSDDYSVSVFFPRSSIDVPFASFIAKRGAHLGPLSLLSLSYVRRSGNSTVAEIASSLGMPKEKIAYILEDLVDKNLIARNEDKYGLDHDQIPSLAPKAIGEEERTRRILALARSREEGISNADIQVLLGIDSDKATYLLRKLTKTGRLIKMGKGKQTFYKAKA